MRGERVASSARLLNVKEGLTATATNGEREERRCVKAIGRSVQKGEAVKRSLLAHAPMEMMNCHGQASADRAECLECHAKKLEGVAGGLV